MTEVLETLRTAWWDSNPSFTKLKRLLFLKETTKKYEQTLDIMSL
jgi:hypothetical protein